MIRAGVLALFAATSVNAQTIDLPSTTDSVGAVSVIALLDDLTSLEGFVWFEGPIVKACLSGISLSCATEVDESYNALIEGVTLQCSGGLTASVDVSTLEMHGGMSLPKRAAGQMSDGRSLIALFGPFRVADGVTCRTFDHGAPPDSEL